MYCIGLTGRIASGKSSVAMYFENLGIHTISADKINHELLQINSPAYEAIVAHFPPEVLLPNKQINKAYLRQILIENKNEKRWLETLLHPNIQASISSAISKITGPYCIVEIPLLINKKDYPYLNRILLVDIDEDTQLQRLNKRTNGSLEENKAFIAIQASREAYQALADDIILNIGNKKNLAKKVRMLHIEYLQLSTLKS